MQDVTPDTQPRQWQIKWGTPGPVCTRYTQVRAYGQLAVDVTSRQRLAACLGVQDGPELEETARGRLKEMVVQALQAVLGEQDSLSFSDQAGSLTPECLAQVTARTSTVLRAQLAEMGLDLGSLVIAGTSYQNQAERSEQMTGGDDCPGCRVIRMQLGLETPGPLQGSEPNRQGLGDAPAIDIAMGTTQS